MLETEIKKLTLAVETLTATLVTLTSAIATTHRGGVVEGTPETSIARESTDPVVTINKPDDTVVNVEIETSPRASSPEEDLVKNATSAEAELSDIVQDLGADLGRQTVDKAAKYPGLNPPGQPDSTLAPNTDDLPPGTEQMSDIQTYVTNRVAEMSAALGRADVMQGLMVAFEITDFGKTPDATLRTFIPVAEKTFSQTLEALKKGGAS